MYNADDKSGENKATGMMLPASWIIFQKKTILGMTLLSSSNPNCHLLSLEQDKK